MCVGGFGRNVGIFLVLSSLNTAVSWNWNLGIGDEEAVEVETVLERSVRRELPEKYDSTVFIPGSTEHYPLEDEEDDLPNNSNSTTSLDLLSSDDSDELKAVVQGKLKHLESMELVTPSSSTTRRSRFNETTTAKTVATTTTTSSSSSTTEAPDIIESGATTTTSSTTKTGTSSTSISSSSSTPTTIKSVKRSNAKKS